MKPVIYRETVKSGHHRLHRHLYSGGDCMQIVYSWPKMQLKSIDVYAVTSLEYAQATGFKTIAPEMIFNGGALNTSWLFRKIGFTDLPLLPQKLQEQ